MIIIYRIIAIILLWVVAFVGFYFAIEEHISVPFYMFYLFCSTLSFFGGLLIIIYLFPTKRNECKCDNKNVLCNNCGGSINSNG